MKKILIGLLLLIPFGTLFSQTLLEAEIRPRVIYDNGYKSIQNPLEPGFAYFSQRTRLSAKYTNEKASVYISFQDVRLWGDDDMFNARGVYGNSTSTGIHQAWLLLTPYKNLSLKLGRQCFSYDDQRILSARGWNDYQVTYDAALITYKNQKHQLEAAFSLNANNTSGVYYSSIKLKTLDFIHYQWKSDNTTLSALALISGKMVSETATSLDYMSTLGAGVNTSVDGYSLRANVYLQNGIFNNLEKPSFCLSVEVGKLMNNEQFKASVGTDLLAGANEYQSTFDLLYGKRHGHYGYMDYFSTTPAQGLVDVFGKATYFANDNLALSVDYHYFAQQQSISNDKPHPTLGNEIDVTCTWKYTSDITLQAGYSAFIPPTYTLSNTTEETVKLQHFLYLMITAKPSLFRSKD